MAFAGAFRANTPHVVHEVIEGEAILINLQNGSYYSTSDVGSLVWTLIEKSTPVAQIVDRVSAAYRGNHDEVDAGIRGLLDELQREGLIVPDGSADSSSVQDADPATPAGASRPPFVAPVLRKYTDMEDLLLLDPIHDVDETGWPNRAKDHSV